MQQVTQLQKIEPEVASIIRQMLSIKLHYRININQVQKVLKNVEH